MLTAPERRVAVAAIEGLSVQRSVHVQLGQAASPGAGLERGKDPGGNSVPPVSWRDVEGAQLAGGGFDRAEGDDLVGGPGDDHQFVTRLDQVGEIPGVSDRRREAQSAAMSAP